MFQTANSPISGVHVICAFQLNMSLFSLGKWWLETSVNKYYGEMVRKCLSCIRQVNISFLCNQWFSITMQCSVQSRPLSTSLLWRHNGRDGVSNYQPHDCLLKRLFRRRSKETPKLRVTGLCEGNSLVTGEFPAQTASNAENVWWRHHVATSCPGTAFCITGLLWPPTNA